MEITIGVSIGSSIQIAIGVIPFLVLLGWIIHIDLTASSSFFPQELLLIRYLHQQLYFGVFETVILFISVLLVSFLPTELNGQSADRRCFFARST